MNTVKFIQVIAKKVKGQFSLLHHKGCRKVDQILDRQSGKLYELFRDEDGSFSVWETDADGISTFWDCGDRWQSKQDINFASLQLGGDIY